MSNKISILEDVCVVINSMPTDATSGAGTTYQSRALLCVVFCRSLLVLYLSFSFCHCIFCPSIYHF